MSAAEKTTNALKALLHTVFPVLVKAEPIKIKHPFRLLGQKVKIAKKYQAVQLVLEPQGKILHIQPEMKLVSKKSFKMTGRYHLADSAMPPKQVRHYLTLGNGDSIKLDPTDLKQNALLKLPPDCPHQQVTISVVQGKLVIHNPSNDNAIVLSSLPSRKPSKYFLSHRIKRLKKLQLLFGGSIHPLTKKKAFKLIRKVNGIMEKEALRPVNSLGMPGGLVEIPADQPVFVIGDLHAKPDNLLVALTHNGLLEALERNRAYLIVLGDAVHPEGNRPLDEMDTSMLIMDMIFKLKVRFPDQLFYLKGNHDSFSGEIAKGGVPQGLLWQRKLIKVRGKAYQKQMQRFYDLLSFVAVSPCAVLCHAAPPLSSPNYDMFIELHQYPALQKELILNRIRIGGRVSGYTKADVKRFRVSLAVADDTAVIVGHTPLDSINTIWHNVGDADNHFIVYSSDENWVGSMAQIEQRMYAICYPVEPLIDIINSLPGNH